MIQGSSGEMAGAAREPWSPWFVLVLVLASACGIVGAWYFAGGQFVLGSGLLCASVLLLRWPRSIWAPTARVDLSPHWQRRALLVVCAVAVFFRSYQINPPGLWGDDAINGLLAFDVLDGKIRSPLEFVDHSFSTFHALTNYIIAGAFLLLGPDPLSIRIPGILANLLCVPALYGIVAPLFGPRAAIIAALFFASSPFEIGHAKGLLQDILGQSLAIVGVCCLVQGALRDRRWLLVMSGVPIALALYTYHAAKLVPLIAAFALWQVLRIARPRGIAVGRAALLAVAVFLLCATPAVLGYLGHPEALTARLSHTGLWATIQASGNLWPLWDSVWRTLAVFHYRQGPIYHWFGIGTDPGTTAVVAFLIVHGIVQSLRHCRQPAHALLLGWFVIGLLPGLLSSEAPRGYRILNGAPVVFVWAALPLARVLSFTPRPGPTLIGHVVALMLVLAVPIVDFNYYFYRVYTSGVFRWFQADAMVEMARTLRSYGPGWTGYLVADNFTTNYESLRFLTRAWNLRVRDVPNLGDVLPVRDLSGDGALFMIMRTPFEGIALLRSMYPDVAVDIRYEPTPRISWVDNFFGQGAESMTPMTVAFFPVSKELALSTQGLTANYGSATHRVVVTRVEPQPLLRGSASVPREEGGNAAVGAMWTGSLMVPAEGAYQFRLDTNMEALLSIDAQDVATRETPIAMLVLAPGLHRITIATRFVPEPHLQLMWKKPGPGEKEATIPPEVFFRFPGNGVLAEYETVAGPRRRIEPFPYHMFFAPQFDGRYAGRWSGGLIVPRPGGYKLSIESDRAATLEVDGNMLTGDERLTSGSHTFAVRIEGIEGPARLRLYWQLGDHERELIPPTAFTP